MAVWVRSWCRRPRDSARATWLPIEKRRQYEEKPVYLRPHSALLGDLMRYAIEYGLARDAASGR